MNPCDPQTSTCRNTPGGYHCICKGGFFKSGIICDDRDECKEKTALCEQKCVNNFGSYTCGCEKGFTLNADGITCDGRINLFNCFNLMLFTLCSFS